MSDSKTVFRDAELHGWKQALTTAFTGEALDLAAHPERAAFVQVLPVREGARVLELAPGWGNITIELARASYRVVAVEEDADRARFVALRARSEGVNESIEVAAAIPAAAKFEAIILHDPALDCISRLPTLRERLAPGGVIYLGGPIRHPWGGEGSSYATYLKLFAQAGFQVRDSYASPRGFRNPSELVPLQARAIEHYTRMRIEPPGSSLPRAFKNRAKLSLASPGSWKILAPSFVFFLEAAHA